MERKTDFASLLKSTQNLKHSIDELVCKNHKDIGISSQLFILLSQINFNIVFFFLLFYNMVIVRYSRHRMYAEIDRTHD